MASKTRLNKLVVERFRALSDVNLEFGDYITVVCGKNGTSKSSILGIAAQIFSFEKDYVENKSLSFRQIGGGSFKSQYSEHIRISEKFDVPGSMTVHIELHDGYTNQATTAKLELMKRQAKRGNTLPRPVVRNNSTASGNRSRNFTHPVIFLSLKRLYPIAARDYRVSAIEYLDVHKEEFLGLTNEILNRSSLSVTGTAGTISSAVAHGDDYDQDSVSAGEDNVGQIVLALMSFRRLKEEYQDYKGGLLLIDEADAGLFPTAQTNLIRMLERECKELNLQVIMTSHSPVIIEHAFNLSQRFRRNYKTIYLSNTYGNVQVMQDWSWAQISADISTKTLKADAGTSLPPINVYFEDGEAADFFAALMVRQPIKKFTRPLPDITLGCSNYLQLIGNKIPEFAEKSIVCLDADVAPRIKGKNLKTVVLLPGLLPPDQLIFEHLYNLPADHDFWFNELQFTRSVFTNSARELLSKMNITGETVDIATVVAGYDGKPAAREIFKRFYKNSEIRELFASPTKPYNPWKHWVTSNPSLVNEFLENFNRSLYSVMKDGYSVDVGKLGQLRILLKKV